LSTVDQPGYVMGKEAFRLLLDEIHSKRNKQVSKNEIVEIPTQIIPRHSTQSIN